MEIFVHENKKCITVNGKDYFLLRYYEKGYNKQIFFQVSGNTPLNKEDCPAKDWEVLGSRANNERVWTAYNRNYFCYGKEKENPVFAFLGMTTKSSYFIALQYIAFRFDLPVEEKKLSDTAEKFTLGKKRCVYIEQLPDKGNSNEDMVIVEFSECFDAKTASRIFKGGEQE